MIGDSFLDRDVEGEVGRICPDSPAPVLEESRTLTRPGGAALAAVMAARLLRQRGDDAAAEVTLVTGVCDDDPGRELATLVGRAGVRLVPFASEGSTTVKIRLRAGGHTLVRLDQGGPPGRLGSVPPSLAAELLSDAGAVLVADYGRGMAVLPGVREILSACDRPVVWDPHPRGPDPVRGCLVLTPNASELLQRWGADTGGNQMARLTDASRRALDELGATSVAVTRGERGALLVARDSAPLAVPVIDAHGGDTCGAGDCFAASVALGLAEGALPSEAVTRAVADAAAFVAAGGAAAYPDSLATVDAEAVTASDPIGLAERVRSAGGTVVAAGGCFDLLHAGHVSLLRSARALGDCLIVCLNSDSSVKRLKGESRPVNHQADRAATLTALDCVDAVAVFEEDTPEQVIRRLRPDVWVKGGDYDATRLPEASTLAEWGGQAVVLPYLAGRSTTGMLARVASQNR